MRQLAIVPFVIFLSGCASTDARTVFRDRDGGVIAIPENTDSFPSYYRSQAQDLMAEHLGRDYEIIREEEYVLGPVVTNETQFNRRPIFNWFVPWKLAESAKTTNTSTTRNQTEYRLHFQRASVNTPTGQSSTPSGADLPPLAEAIGTR